MMYKFPLQSKRILIFQLGAALGFLIPPMIVQDSENLEDIGSDLWTMFVSFAVVDTVVFLLVIWSKCSPINTYIYQPIN